MDEERYANDVCLGEVSIPLKKIAPFAEDQENGVLETIEPADASDEKEKDSLPAILVSSDKATIEMNTYTLFPMKEVSEPNIKRLSSVPWQLYIVRQ